MDKIDQINLKEKIAQMLVLGFYGDKLSTDSAFARELITCPPGGLILFARKDMPGYGNITGAAQLSALTSDLKRMAKYPLWIALDQEGGFVSRLTSENGFHTVSSAMKIGKIKNPAKTQLWAKTIATDLIKAGINLNLAPVVDLDIYRDSPVIGKQKRCFSAEPEPVIQMAQIFCRQMKKHGILSCLKHFPGHGSARTDSHRGFTNISDTWQKKELQPYKVLLAQNAAELVMVCHVYHHVLDGEFPASLSHRIITELLRKKIGWQGLVITDDLQMKAISNHFTMEESLQRAILAGNDLLMIANNDPEHYYSTSDLVNLIKKMIDKDKIPLNRIQESFARISAAKQVHRN